MEVLTSDEPWRAPEPPPVLVALAAAVVLLGGLLALGPVARAERLTDVAVRIGVEGATRELGGGAFGEVLLDVDADVVVEAVDFRIPGVRFARVRDLPTAPPVRVRFVVVDCGDVHGPASVLVRAHHPGRESRVLVREVDATPFLRLCGRVLQE